MLANHLTSKQKNLKSTKIILNSKEIEIFLIENGLKALKGIQSVKIIAKNEKISQVHLVVNQKVQPKEIANQVRTFLLVRFGINLEDSTIIFVASLRD